MEILFRGDVVATTTSPIKALYAIVDMESEASDIGILSREAIMENLYLLNEDPDSIDIYSEMAIALDKHSDDYILNGGNGTFVTFSPKELTTSSINDLLAAVGVDGFTVR